VGVVITKYHIYYEEGFTSIIDNNGGAIAPLAHWSQRHLEGCLS
jgi:hypothetical protein